MNKEVRRALEQLETAVIGDMCEGCSMREMIRDMADDVNFEMFLVANLIGTEKSKPVWEKAAEFYEEEEYELAINCLSKFLEKYKAKCSKYIFSIVSKSELGEFFLLDFLFNTNQEVDDFDDAELEECEDVFDDEEYEPIENEGYC